MFYLNLQKLYRLYNNHQSIVSINKLSLQKHILHTQEVLKIKKTKLKKGRVKFSFHSLFYGNLLLFQSFEVELVGDTKKKESREFLENELNPKKWYKDRLSLFFFIFFIFLLASSLEVYLMHFIKTLVIVDSEISQIFSSYFKQNFKFFGHLASVIQFFKIL